MTNNAAERSDEKLQGRAVLQILWRKRITLTLITLSITGIVAAAAYLIPAKYEATVLMMAVPDSETEDKIGGGIGSAMSSLGGLASLAGLSSSGSNLKVEAMATLESEALTVRYIRDNNLLPVLYKSRWDAIKMQWKTTDPKKIPTLWKANRYFKGVRTVTDNVRTGLITLVISWRDPAQAAKWANDLVAMTNEYLRTKAIDEAQQNISFLEAQAMKSSVVAVQEAIAALTESQLRKIMLAKSRQQYALRVIDPATVPEKQSFPVPAIWIPAAFFGGLFIGILIILLRTSEAEVAPQYRAELPGSERD